MWYQKKAERSSEKLQSLDDNEFLQRNQLKFRKYGRKMTKKNYCKKINEDLEKL